MDKPFFMTTMLLACEQSAAIKVKSFPTIPIKKSMVVFVDIFVFVFLFVLELSVGDTVAFGEYISKNLKLNKLRNGNPQSPWSTANYTRHQLATALRSRNSYQVNMLVGGYGDDKDGTEAPQLYFIDYLAAMTQAPFACQGYGGYFTYSILDKHYKEGMSREETMELLKRCIKEVRHRFMVQMPRFKVHIIDKDGITHLEDIFEL